jgi:adenylate kinase
LPEGLSPRRFPEDDSPGRGIEKIGIKLDAAINLDVPTEVILDRLTTRRTCSNPDCQEIYNIKSKPPKPDGTCFKCGSPAVQRADETEEAIKQRLETYNEKTAPLIDFYKKEGLLIKISSLDSMQIRDDIIKALKK